MKRIAPWFAVVLLVAIGAATVAGNAFSNAMRLLVIG